LTFRKLEVLSNVEALTLKLSKIVQTEEASTRFRKGGGVKALRRNSVGEEEA